MKFTEAMIEAAYLEFKNSKDRVSCISHEIVAYDFLMQNVKVTDFLKKREIFLPHLCSSIAYLISADNKNERYKQIREYCEQNEISFNKYKSIEFLINYKNNDFHSCNLEEEDYREFIYEKNKGPIEKEDIEKTIIELSEKLLLAKQYKQYFGIIEYYSYFDISLETLKKYLLYVTDYKDEYVIISDFIEKLEKLGQLEKIDVQTALNPKTKKRVVNDLYLNDDVFKRITAHLLIAEYPIVTGTINYAYGLESQGELGRLYKKKVRQKFENKIELNKNNKDN